MALNRTSCIPGMLLVILGLMPNEPKNELPKIGFIVGAGSVENAWDPILKIFKEGFKKSIDRDQANCWLARQIYLLRWFNSRLGPSDEKEFKAALKRYEATRVAIADQIRASQSTLRPQKEFQAVVDQFVFCEPCEFYFVTTNWDNTIDRHLKERLTELQGKEPEVFDVIHIHGSADKPEELYLPSEVADEPYRTVKEGNRIAIIHREAMDALGKVDRLVIYGLSLDPLDAELSQIFSSAIHDSKVQKIDVIDPEHQKVARRLQMLLPDQSEIQIIGYHPEGLANGVRHR